MIDRDQVAKRKEALAIFKLGMKASARGVHRTLNRPPKGKGWVQCANGLEGLMCRPDKLREAIGLFAKSYAIFPDIVALNQVALGYEMLGERERAREHFQRMKEQAERESNPAYAAAAVQGLERLKG